MKENNSRQYGLDVLRIMLAFMVITLHINAGATGKVLSYSSVVPWKYIVGVATTLCYPAVNCYILICGYFSWNKNSDVKKKLFRLWLSILFFSVLGYLIVCIFGKQSFNVLELAKHLFPLIRGKWWYMVDYFALILLSPILNKAIACLSETSHRNLNILNVFLFSIIPMINNWNDQFGTNYGYGLLWFISLYFLGAYFSKYNLIEKIKLRGIKHYQSLFLFTVFLLTSFSILLLSKILGKFGVDFYLNPYNSVFTLLQAIFLFMFFAELKVNNNILIYILTKIAPLALASYLLHCQEDIDVFLWETVKPWEYANNIMILFVWFMLVFGIFVTGIILEKIRQIVFGKINIKLEEFIWKKDKL